ECHGVGIATFFYQRIAYNLIDYNSDQYKQRSFLQMLDSSGIHEPFHSLDDDEQRSDNNDRSLKSSGKKLDFTMAVRVISIFGLGRQVYTIKCKPTGNYVDD